MMAILDSGNAYDSCLLVLGLLISYAINSNTSYTAYLQSAIIYKQFTHRPRTSYLHTIKYLHTATDWLAKKISHHHQPPSQTVIIVIMHPSIIN
jgi:hypothetical protein